MVTVVAGGVICLIGQFFLWREVHKGNILILSDLGRDQGSNTEQIVPHRGNTAGG